MKKRIEEITEKEMMERFQKASESYLPPKTRLLECRKCENETEHTYKYHSVVQETVPRFIGRPKKTYTIGSHYECPSCGSESLFEEAELRLDLRKLPRKSKIIYC